MANVTEYHSPADRLTYTATATITGGQLVELTGDRTIGPAGAGSVKCVGIAMQDCAVGAKVGVASEGVWPVVSGGVITAGMRLKCGAAGVAVPFVTDASGLVALPNSIVGIALEAIASAATGRVKLTNLG